MNCEYSVKFFELSANLFDGLLIADYSNLLESLVDEHRVRTLVLELAAVESQPAERLRFCRAKVFPKNEPRSRDNFTRFKALIHLELTRFQG